MLKWWVLFLLLLVSGAHAQNPTVPTRPLGDNSNAAASTGFVWQQMTGSTTGTFTPNAPVVGNVTGNGLAPGVRSGNTITFPTVDTTPVTGNCLVYDSLGGIANQACNPSGSGTVGTGLAHDIATYPINGTSVAGTSQSQLTPVSVFNGLNSSQITDVTSGACTLDLGASLNTFIGSNPGAWYFPPGTYCTSTPLIIHTHQQFLGAGKQTTIIRALAGTATPLIQTDNFASLLNTNTQGGPYQFTIANLSLDGNKANVTGTAQNNLNIYGFAFILSAFESYNATNDGIYSQWATGTGVPVPGTNTGMEAHGWNVQAYSNTGNGILWQGPHDSVFTDVLTFINGQLGYLQQTSATYDGLMVLNTIHSYGNGTGGMFVDGTAGHTGFLEGTNIQAESNLSNGGFNVGLNAQVWINGGLFYGNTGNGLGIAGNNSRVTGVTAELNSSAGIFITGAGNIVTGSLSPSNTVYGVQITGTGNVIVGALSTGNGTANYNIAGGNHTSGNF